MGKTTQAGTIINGVFVPNIDLTNLSNKMKEVIVMGNLDAKETAEFVYAVAKLASAAREAKENDGEITASDAMLLMPVVIPLFNGVKGANKIPAEFTDGYSEADQAQITAAWNEGSSVHQNDKVAVEKALKVVYAINDLLSHTGTIAPDAPTV